MFKSKDDPPEDVRAKAIELLNARLNRAQLLLTEPTGRPPPDQRPRVDAAG